MSYYIIFAILFLSSACLAYITGKGIARTASVTNFSLILVLYVAGLFARLDIGMYVFFSLCALLFICAVVRLVRKKDFSVLSRSVLNPAGIFYLVAGIAFGVLFARLISYHWDETTHWALVVKNMVAYDNFGNLGDTTTMFNRYVPGCGVFLYAFQFFNNTLVNGHFASAFGLLVFSMLLPVTALFKNDRSVGCMVTLIATLLLALVFDLELYFCLLVDGILGVCTAYVYLSYLVDRKKTDWFTFVSIGLGALALTLIKTSGVALVVFALVYILVDMLTRSRDNAKFFLKKRAWMFVIPIVLLIFAKVSWSLYCNAYQVRAGWDSSEMTLPNLWAYLTHPNAFQQEVTRTFFRTYFIGPFRYEIAVFLQMPNLFLYAVVGVACLALWFGTKNKVFAGVQFATMILLLFGYGVVLLVLYIFSFSYGESLELASYGRYYCTLVIATVLVLFYQCIEIFVAPRCDRKADAAEPVKTRKKTLVSLATYACVLIVLFVGICAGCIPAIDRLNEENYGDYRAWIAAVSTLDDEDSVYYVMADYQEEHECCRVYLRVRYLCTPVRCSGFSEGGSYADGRGAKLYVTGNPFSMDMTEEDFLSETAKYGYLFIDDATPAFVAKFGKYFDGEPQSQVLYLRTETETGPLFVLPNAAS